ncbi:hypothetical protein [Micromonospora sp. NBS 11-29]|uniref:hypothetical protein n=1 Tax=Micromonospora sp. NBS 11-29 TaxID=1960879 RepID=UPI001C38BCCA
MLEREAAVRLTGDDQSMGLETDTVGGDVQDPVREQMSARHQQLGQVRGGVAGRLAEVAHVLGVYVG